MNKRENIKPERITPHLLEIVNTKLSLEYKILSRSWH